MEQVDLNVCKNNYCEGFGISGADSLSGPVYRLGFKAYHCSLCDSYPPVLDNQGFTAIWRETASTLGKLTAKYCPECGCCDFIQFGQSSLGIPRYRCKQCHKTFSRWTAKHNQQMALSELDNSLTNTLIFQQYLAQTRLKRNQVDRLLDMLAKEKLQQRYQLPISSHVATVAWTVPFKGKGNRLWVLCSTDVNTGKVLLLTTNWISKKLPPESCYCPEKPCNDQSAQTPFESEHAMEMAQRRSRQFLDRPQFDQLNYGQSKLQANEQSIIKPVLAAHNHWRHLNMLGHACENGHHYIFHEIFLRGASMTQYWQEVKNGNCRISYVSGEGPAANGNLTETKVLGWWQNRWYHFNDGDDDIAVSPLVPNVPLAEVKQATLAPCYRFIESLAKAGWTELFSQSTPLRVKALLECLATQYNKDDCEPPKN